ncbi:MAG TPA: PAS domain S-box protein [Acidimicrobiales bacterium]|nr:PAS domain S-box protein [Acidimicrobiales bacterium]
MDSHSAGALSPEAFRAMADAIPDAVVIVDAAGAIVYWNQGAVRVFGRSAEQALGDTLDIIVPERLRDRHWEGFRSAVASGQSRYGPDELLAVPAVRADGTQISIEFTVALLPSDGEGDVHVAAVIRDVTERRNRERELRRRLEALGSPPGD